MLPSSELSAPYQPQFRLHINHPFRGDHQTHFQMMLWQKSRVTFLLVLPHPHQLRLGAVPATLKSKNRRLRPVEFEHRVHKWLTWGSLVPVGVWQRLEVTSPSLKGGLGT